MNTNTNGEAGTQKGERQGPVYSPERRTALVLCGTGAHGAYHAGVLKALQEAGVKIDVMAGQGVGAAAAALAAVDGAARLWDETGIWCTGAAGGLYRRKSHVRTSERLAAAVAIAAAVSLLAAAAGFGPAVVRWLATATVIGAGVLVSVVVGAAVIEGRAPVRRSGAGASWWRAFGAPLDAERARTAFAEALWRLLLGETPPTPPTRTAIGRRYADVLTENLGQPGFRELMIVTTDLDSRRDLVAALLREPFRRDFVAPREGEERRSEIIDLAGDGRDHAFDVVAAALTPPVACNPHLITFGVDSYWRGETHRLCDRPGACARLLEELADAGVTQVIIVSAVTGRRVPHRLTAVRLQPSHRLGEFLAASESAAVRDARKTARLRFDAIHVIGPAHNPIGPFDMAGAYDEASDRMADLKELMHRAYEDTYRQFIEPAVGASGDLLVHAGGWSA